MERYGNFNSSDEGYGGDMPQEKIFELVSQLFPETFMNSVVGH
jgi:hypothetical protein